MTKPRLLQDAAEGKNHLKLRWLSSKEKQWFRKNENIEKRTNLNHPTTATASKRKLFFKTKQNETEHCRISKNATRHAQQVAGSQGNECPCPCVSVCPQRCLSCEVTVDLRLLKRPQAIAPTRPAILRHLRVLPVLFTTWPRMTKWLKVHAVSSLHSHSEKIPRKSQELSHAVVGVRIWVRVSSV